MAETSDSSVLFGSLAVPSLAFLRLTAAGSRGGRPRFGIGSDGRAPLDVRARNT